MMPRISDPAQEETCPGLKNLSPGFVLNRYDHRTKQDIICGCLSHSMPLGWEV